MGKLKLRPIKSRNEGAVTYFFVCFVVLTQGVHRSDMGLLGPVASICAILLTDRQMDGQMPDVRLYDQRGRKADEQMDRRMEMACQVT